MKKHHRITRSERSLEQTLNLHELLNIRVLTKKGLVLGKVSHIRLHPTKLSLEGIVVSRGVFKKDFYIGASYIQRLSNDSFILKIDPSILLKGRRVLAGNGKVVGRVKEVLRKEHSNEIKELIVSSTFRKDFSIREQDVKYFGESIILKSSHNVPKKYFWQKA